MADSTTPRTKKCPQCNAVVRNTYECVRCGLLFNRFFAAQAKKEELHRQRGARRARRKYLARLTGLYLLLLSLHAGAWATLVIKHEFFLGGIASTVHWVQSLNQEEQVRMYNPADKSFLDRARQATVTIETPIGSGSGFFITPDQIITNRHVVDYDSVSTVELERKNARDLRIVELEGEKLKELKKQLKKLPNGPSRKQLKLIIEEKEEAFAKALEIHKERQEKLAGLKSRLASPVVKVYLYDGTEFMAGYIEKSSRQDLALINLPQVRSGYLTPIDPGKILQQGDQVYVIGSPKGLVNTVTSGIFSGYRWKSDGSRFLQVDAPINPGNSGGPLINQFGEVLGINTSKYIDAEGIGFAISIEAVFDEFRHIIRD